MVGMTALTRRRPTKTSDGAGGFTEALGTAYAFYGTLSYHKNETVLIVEVHEDVDPEDQIEAAAEDGAAAAKYRVGQIQRTAGDRYKLCALSRMDRPIEA